MIFAFIDDEEEILNVYSYFLEDLSDNYNVSGKYFLGSQSFLEPGKIEETVSTVDAIFCDLAMPKSDGRIVLDKVISARRKLNRNVPFFIVTGAHPNYMNADESGWGHLSKADEVVDKPLIFDDFRKLLVKHGLLIPGKGSFSDS